MLLAIAAKSTISKNPTDLRNRNRKDRKVAIDLEATGKRSLDKSLAASERSILECLIHLENGPAANSLADCKGTFTSGEACTERASSLSLSLSLSLSPLLSSPFASSPLPLPSFSQNRGVNNARGIHGCRLTSPWKRVECRQKCRCR